MYQNIVILDTQILLKVHIKKEGPVQNVMLNHIDLWKCQLKDSPISDCLTTIFNEATIVFGSNKSDRLD